MKISNFLVSIDLLQLELQFLCKYFVDLLEFQHKKVDDFKWHFSYEFCQMQKHWILQMLIV